MTRHRKIWHCPMVEIRCVLTINVSLWRICDTGERGALPYPMPRFSTHTWDSLERTMSTMGRTAAVTWLEV